ncbi:MAG: YajD family HNH nuclease [Burkholderiales bacterium]
MDSVAYSRGMAKLDDLVAQARKAQQERARSYREQALKILPWICGRCAREFGRERLRELTVHHRDGNHDNNPPDGSNWELLCVYCHENEHARVEDSKLDKSGQSTEVKPATHRAFEGLDNLLKKK